MTRWNMSSNGACSAELLASIFAIGVDEIQYARGHKYLTLVYQIDRECIRLLWAGRERTIESFQGFFRVIGEKVAAEILFVCSDMWKPYRDVIGEKCVNTLHILERFHIMAKMGKALDEVRTQETRRLILLSVPCRDSRVAFVVALLGFPSLLAQLAQFGRGFLGAPAALHCPFRPHEIRQASVRAGAVAPDRRAQQSALIVRPFPVGVCRSCASGNTGGGAVRVRERRSGPPVRVQVS